MERRSSRFLKRKASELQTLPVFSPDPRMALGGVTGSRISPGMSPQDIIAKYRNAELKERSASQSHFNDLCRLLGVEDPISADPKGGWFTFEKGATTTRGGEGWADVWRKGCFAWEY
jgi:hypothetical protein